MTEPILTASNPLVTAFVAAIAENKRSDYARNYPSLEAPRVVVTPRRKYFAVDIDNGTYRTGMFMIDPDDGHVYGIKGYGVINRDRDMGPLELATERFTVKPPPTTLGGDSARSLAALKRCPDCDGRFIPENQARCLACAQVTPCGATDCECAR